MAGPVATLLVVGASGDKSAQGGYLIGRLEEVWPIPEASSSAVTSILPDGGVSDIAPA